MYDIIVIGNDLSSLTAAVHSSHSGKKTILLNDIDIPDFYSSSGYTFDIDPFPWTGFEPKGIFTQMLSEFDLPINTSPLNPALQMIFPEHRFDVLSETTSQIKEIEREIGRNSIKLRKFYKTILKADNFLSKVIRDNPRIRPGTAKEFFKYLLGLPGIIWRKRDFTKRFNRIQANPLLKKAFLAELLLFSNLNPEGISPLSFAYLLSIPFKGLYYQIGGKYRLIDALKRKIESNGGMVKNFSALQLSIDEDIVVDIATQNDNTFTIEGKNVIISTKWKGFLPFMSGDDRYSSIVERYMGIEPSHYSFTVHIGFSEASIPEKMSEYSVLISDDIYEEGNDFFKENIFFLELSAVGDRGRAPENKRALSVTAFLKASPLDLSNKELKEVSILMIKSLDGYLPFLNEGIDFIDIDGSIDISRKFQGSLNQKYSAQQSPVLGISLLSNKTPLKNLRITGGILLAGLGIEGEVISGLNAAKSLTGGDGDNVHNQQIG